MARVEVRLPQYAMGMAEGVLLRWLRRVGDAVQEGESIAEIETAKASGVMEAPASGLLAEILVQEGATVPVGALMAVIHTP